ncbi:hypothetical protein RQP46_010094 [Phenoliferia psychrophenolica]
MFKSTDIVVVTGANGHVASHIVDQLLALPDGPVVRGTVRTQESASIILGHYPTHSRTGRLEIIVVPDMLAEGAFVEVVKGATHIAHVASPLVIGGIEDVAKQLLQPAMKGTLGILEAASQSSSVKAVVITSSFGAVFDPAEGWRAGHAYTSEDLNPITFEVAADPKLDLSSYPETWRAFVTYCASKVLAEKAAWTTSPTYSLCTILPTYIGGPSVLPLKDGAKSVSFSQALIWKTATESTLPTLDFPGWVHVSDVARAHIAALERGVTGRYIVSEGNHSYEKIKTWDTDSSAALKDLGLGSYIPLERTVVETVQQLLAAETLRLG